MKRHYLITFCITFIFALIIRLIFFFQISSHPISKLDIVFTGSDMHGNLNWATEILNGDILGQDTYHPYHKWMKEIANENTWHKWWGGKQIFQQVPLYPYFLAVLLRITKHNIEIMRLIQLFIGSLTAGIIALISYFLFGKREGLFSGIIAALYFPFLCYEFFFLRDFLAVHFLC